MQKENTDKQIILLGLETSGLTSGVYLSMNNQLLAEMSLNVRNVHSRGIALFIDQVLKLTEIGYDQISAVVISAGPGSFTGLRIGYSVAKGMLHALQKPLIEIPTLDVWAYQQGQLSVPVFSFIDAHRQEIFYAFYRWDDQKLKRESNYQIMPFDEVNKRITEKTFFVGPDVGRWMISLQNSLGERALFAYPIQQQLQGWALLQLGYEKFMAGQFSDLHSCEPMYLRPFKGIL